MEGPRGGEETVQLVLISGAEPGRGNLQGSTWWSGEHLWGSEAGSSSDQPLCFRRSTLSHFWLNLMKGRVMTPRMNTLNLFQSRSNGGYRIFFFDYPFTVGDCTFFHISDNFFKSDTPIWMENNETMILIYFKNFLSLTLCFVITRRSRLQTPTLTLILTVWRLSPHRCWSMRNFITTRQKSGLFTRPS